MGSFLLGKTFNTVHDSYLSLGLSKGSVIFVSVNDLNTIIARFSLHRQAVVQIFEMKEKKRFLSVCEEHLLNVIYLMPNNL